jgi:hypothetical protein
VDCIDFYISLGDSKFDYIFEMAMHLFPGELVKAESNFLTEIQPSPERERRIRN